MGMMMRDPLKRLVGGFIAHPKGMFPPSGTKQRKQRAYRVCKQEFTAIPLITAKPAKYPSVMVIATTTAIQNNRTSGV
jgi:hypothetical protein